MTYIFQIINMHTTIIGFRYQNTTVIINKTNNCGNPKFYISYNITIITIITI